MTQAQLDQMCAQALKRIKEFVNRSAGQHKRELRKAK